MTCRHCSCWNAAEEHRCARCGRRHEFEPVFAGAYLAEGESGRLAAEPVAPRFAVAEPAARRVAFNTISYYSPDLACRRTQRNAVGLALTPRIGNASVLPEVDTFEPLPQRRHDSLRVSIETVIYTDAPVAHPVHRLMAAAFDFSFITIAAALFAATPYLGGVSIELNRVTGSIFGGIALLIAVSYRLFWCYAETDSPGLQMVGLRAIGFDGETPSRSQRLQRAACGYLSLLSAGLGVVWTMVDEERLSWHDHLSRSFPTTRR